MNIANLKKINNYYICPFCDEGYLEEKTLGEARIAESRGYRLAGFHCPECDTDTELTEGGEIV